MIAACGGSSTPTAVPAVTMMPTATVVEAAPSTSTNVPADAGAPADANAQSTPPAMGTPGQEPGAGPGANMNMTRAAELPTSEPNVTGMIASRNGNSITIRSGRPQGQRGAPADGTAPAEGGAPPEGGAPAEGTAPAAGNAGVTVEVIVDAETKIYKDTTQIDQAAQQNGQEIQQTVEQVDSLDALDTTKGAMLQVWGESSTDGVWTADVIVYSEVTGRPNGQQTTP